MACCISNPEVVTENPLDQIRQNQTNPQAAGVLQGQQPAMKSEDDKIWEAVKNAGDKNIW